MLSPLAVQADAQITIEGLEGDVRDAALAALSLGRSCEQPRWQVRYRFRNAPSEIRRALETYGYYSANVESELDFEESCFSARFTVNVGPVTTITRSTVAVRGGDGLFEPILQRHPLREGARLDHVVYEGFKSDINDLAARYGFLEGRFSSQQVLVDASADSATIDLVYETGPRYRFGEITFEPDVLEPQKLARYQPFDPGAPYDSERLNALYLALIESGYFDDVVVETLDPVDKRLPVSVELIPGKTRYLRAGVGISTDYGPGLSLQQNNRLLNRKGHQRSLELSVSAVETEIGGTYRIPQTSRADTWLTLYGGFIAEDTETSRTESTTVGIRRSSPRGQNWIETLFFEVNFDDFDIAGTSDDTIYLVPGVNYTYTWTDDALVRPARAHRFGIEVSGASRATGSSVNFASVRVDGRIVRQLTENIRILGRSRIGATMTDSFERLPPRVRFFSGGDSRVRGFDFESIGVADEGGNIIGGDRLMEFSLELDRSIADNWAIATFVDAASVSLSSFSDHFRRAAGIGVRWYSPLGPVRFDIAKPIDPEGGSVRLHISLGPDL